MFARILYKISLLISFIFKNDLKVKIIHSAYPPFLHLLKLEYFLFAMALDLR
jgi:hypothetical protein